jgi:integrase
LASVKRCLRQFADHRRVRALLNLPTKLVSVAARAKGAPRQRAVRVELALAVAIELVLPLRMDNLAGLRLDRHIHRVGGKPLLVIPAEETKNSNPIEAELPRDVAELLDLYVRQYRPRLLASPSPWLFPGQSGGRRTTGGFGAQLSALIRKEAGVTMTPHQFRHLAAKLYLDRHPGDYETVRRLLAHKSLVTTMRFYRELDSALAVQRYGEVVSELLSGDRDRLAMRRRSGRERFEHDRV